jgi:hypothetical protein
VLIDVENVTFDHAAPAADGRIEKAARKEM